MLDLTKLNSIDVKNINWSKIQDKILQRQDVAIHLGLVLLTLLIAFNLYAGKKKAAQAMLGQIAVLEKNVQTVNSLKENQKKFDEYFAGLPSGISVDELINRLTDMTIRHSLQIISFSPSNKETKGIFEQTNITIKITAKSYEDIIAFIREVESGKNLLKVDSWLGRLEKNSIRKGRDETPEAVIYAEITVSSVEFKK